MLLFPFNCCIYRVIPVNLTNLFFLITLKVVKLELSYWMEKKQNFMRIFPISMIWKSDHWSLHNALISKSGQNAEKSGMWLFFKLFSVLTIWKCPYNYQMNDLNPNMIPHINASELWNALRYCVVTIVRIFKSLISEKFL